MGRKRRKASFAAVSFSEDRDKEWGTDSSRNKKRKSSINILAGIEPENNIKKESMSSTGTRYDD